MGGGWSVPHPPEETVGDDFSSGVRPGPKFPLAPSQQQDLSRPLPPNSPGFSAALPAPSVAVTVRRYHEGKQHGTLSGTERGFALSELLLCYCVVSLPSRTKTHKACEHAFICFWNHCYGQLATSHGPVMRKWFKQMNSGHKSPTPTPNLSS